MVRERSASGNAPNDGGLQNPLNRHLERGNDDQDVRHRFVASYQYELPFSRGWKGPVKTVLGGWTAGGIGQLCYAICEKWLEASAEF